MVYSADLDSEGFGFLKLILTKGFGDMKATEMIKQKRTWLSKMQNEKRKAPKLTKTNLTLQWLGDPTVAGGTLSTKVKDMCILSKLKQ